MYTEVTIELLSDPSVTIDEVTMQNASNVSNDLRTLNPYGSNKPFKGFFLMSQNTKDPVATLDGSFKCFGANGYDGAVGNTYYASSYTHVYARYVIDFKAIPSAGCTIILDPTGTSQVDRLTVENHYASGALKDFAYVDVDPTYPIITIMPGIITEPLVSIAFRMIGYNRNYCVKVLYVFPNITTIYRGTDLIKYECSENMLDAQLTFTPGICEQYINATVYDRNNVLQQLAAQEKLSTGRIINVYAVDDNFRERIGQYYSEDWDIQNCESDVGITGGDGFKYLSNFDYQVAGVKSRSINNMLTDAFSYAGVQWKYQDNDTQLYCQQIDTPNCWYPDTDIISLLEDICKVAMLRIYYYNGVFIVGRAITW